MFIRHGHVSDNDQGRGARLNGWLDVPLSALGSAQTERLRRHLAAGAPVDALYASPLRRARQTAAALSTTLGIRPRLLDSLREISCGRLDGLPLEEVQRRLPELWRRNLAQVDDDFRWPGGESYRAFRARVLRAVGRIAARHPGRRVVVVTHAGVISQVLGALHGIGPSRWTAFVAGNASITEVRWHDGAGTVLRFDDRDHLAGALPAPGGVGAADHPQLIARQAGGLGAGAGRGAAQPVRDGQVVAQRPREHVAGAGQPVEPT